MSNCYFIDFENVRNSGLSNLKGLDKDDLIFHFYTSDTDTITLNNIDLLNNSGCRYELIKVPAGSQSLDRHLISFAGYAIGIHGNKFDYIIVSKDKGYDCIISFWKARCGISAKRQAAVNVNSAKKTPDGSKAVKDKQTVCNSGKPAPAQTNSKQDPVFIHSEIPEKTDKILQLDSSSEAKEIDNYLNSCSSGDLVDKVKKAVSDGLKEEAQLNAVFCNLKNLTENYRKIYEGVKPLIKRYLKQAVKKKEEKELKSSCDQNVKEKVLNVLKEKKFGDEIIDSAASVVSEKQFEKDGKLQIYRNLIGRFGQEKGLELYRLIKPLL